MAIQTPNEFNQTNVNNLIVTIQNKSLTERLLISSLITADLPGFLAANFILSAQWQDIIANMPPADVEEVATTVAIAFNKGLDLSVEFPDVIPVAAASCKVKDARPARWRDPFTGDMIYGFKLKIVF